MIHKNSAFLNLNVLYKKLMLLNDMQKCFKILIFFSFEIY